MLRGLWLADLVLLVFIKARLGGWFLPKCVTPGQAHCIKRLPFSDEPL
mgnify:CR=1